MNLRTYKATGTGISALRRLLGVRLRATGAENILDRPTIFAVNHFTRVETMLVPYIIYHQVQRPVHSLAAHELFKGWMARYLHSVGVISVRDPRRNRTIIRELMTRESDWIIYPEGGLIKNKKTVHRGKLQLTHPDRNGPPRTGAAVLALKAEIAKLRYREACESGDAARRAYYEQTYDLTDPSDLCADGTIVVPVTFTYYPMRPAVNAINRVLSLLGRELSPRMDEELQVEGSIFMGNCEIGVHFGEPIEVEPYLDRPGRLIRTLAGVIPLARREDQILRRQARKLTATCMRRVYQNIEINLDHLFCSGLRSLKSDTVPIRDFHRAIYLSAIELRTRDDVRVHPLLSNGISAVLLDRGYEPLDSVVRMAVSQGVLEVENGCYRIQRDALDGQHEFHRIRIENTVQVLANEIEPIKDVVSTVAHNVNLKSFTLAERTARVVHETESSRYKMDYERWYRADGSKSADAGEPFYLRGDRHSTGVVLTHGYLSSPEQMRPLGEYLHARGCTVYGVRLHGHGTAPEQLTEVMWQDWLQSVQRGLSVVRQDSDRVIVGGFSLGGTLSALLAGRHADLVDGLFTINAPLRLRDHRAVLIGAACAWNNAMQRLGISDGPTSRCNEDSEAPEINYTLDYLAGIRELRRTMRNCRRSLRAITAPTLILQATDDPVVAPASAQVLSRMLGSSIHRVLDLPFDRHIIVRGTGCEGVFDDVGLFVDHVAANG